jgi:hypothetical protein
MSEIILNQIIFFGAHIGMCKWAQKVARHPRARSRYVGAGCRAVTNSISSERGSSGLSVDVISMPSSSKFVFVQRI